ncbi:MAG TPA: hypothetical protein VG269_08470 [Tepidisphaeraceae bacterium]|nr:hypothetical protein [Tepidisphaeraceae bacterium]
MEVAGTFAWLYSSSGGRQIIYDGSMGSTLETDTGGSNFGGNGYVPFGNDPVSGAGTSNLAGSGSGTWTGGDGGGLASDNLPVPATEEAAANAGDDLPVPDLSGETFPIGYGEDPISGAEDFALTGAFSLMSESLASLWAWGSGSSGATSSANPSGKGSPAGTPTPTAHPDIPATDPLPTPTPIAPPPRPPEDQAAYLKTLNDTLEKLQSFYKQPLRGGAYHGVKTFTGSALLTLSYFIPETQGLATYRDFGVAFTDPSAESTQQAAFNLLPLVHLGPVGAVIEDANLLRPSAWMSPLESMPAKALDLGVSPSVNAAENFSRPLDFSEYTRLNLASGGEFDAADTLHLNIITDDIKGVSGGKIGADYRMMPEIPSNHFPEVVGNNVQFNGISEVVPTAREIFRVTKPGGTIRISFSSQYNAAEAALTEAGFTDVRRAGQTAPHGLILEARKPN